MSLDTWKNVNILSDFKQLLLLRKWSKKYIPNEKRKVYVPKKQKIIF